MAASNRDIHRKAEEIAAGLPPLMVAAERVASTVSQGVHGRRRVGQGETFWQFRRYQSGDSAQLIDWRQSAKSQPLYVRETEWEAAESVWLWRDGSASMHYSSGKEYPAKTDRADLLLLALASLLVRGGEHMALLGSGKTPATGRAALGQVAATLESERTRDEDGHASLPVFEPLPRYARVVMIGDFLSPLDEINSIVGDFAGHGVRGHLLRVLDPAEETLPFSGRIHFEGPEKEGDLIIGRVESVRRDYSEAMNAHHRGLETLVRHAGWTFATHRTDRPPESALLALYLVLSQPGPEIGT
ncbi:MAG: DUF58 domain-containing protein [Proteobacteria bacterium]|nr:DUF58 domain-containing protein [Pseudomonadota bacterium]